MGIRTPRTQRLWQACFLQWCWRPLERRRIRGADALAEGNPEQRCLSSELFGLFSLQAFHRIGLVIVGLRLLCWLSALAPSRISPFPDQQRTCEFCKMQEPAASASMGEPVAVAEAKAAVTGPVVGYRGQHGNGQNR